MDMTQHFINCVSVPHRCVLWKIKSFFPNILIWQLNVFSASLVDRLPETYRLNRIIVMKLIQEIGHARLSPRNGTQEISDLRANKSIDNCTFVRPFRGDSDSCWWGVRGGGVGGVMMSLVRQISIETMKVLNLPTAMPPGGISLSTSTGFVLVHKLETWVNILISIYLS